MRDSEYMSRLVVNSGDIEVQVMSEKEISAKFPFLQLPHTYSALFEQFNSGVISPRALVQAQLQIAAQNNCHIISDEVTHILRSSNAGRFEVHLKASAPLIAKRVVVCAGSFVNTRPLLPDSQGPPLPRQYFLFDVFVTSSHDFLFY